MASILLISVCVCPVSQRVQLRVPRCKYVVDWINVFFRLLLFDYWVHRTRAEHSTLQCTTQVFIV